MTTPATNQIIRRRVNIDFARPGTDWHKKKKDVEVFLNAVSFVFPPGEKFFVHSVQNYLPKITDPVLKDQARRFIYQEAMHSKEHGRCNEVVKESHPYGDKIEKFVEFGLWCSKKLTPKASQLAFTCALEHFTAMLADDLLRKQDKFVAETRPDFAALWMWHAVEETEHKAVAFDVYEHCVGKGFFAYLLRIFMMMLATMGFLIATSVALVIMKFTKGKKKKPAATRTKTVDKPPVKEKSSLGLWFKRTVLMDMYLDYYKPAFHPWKYDNAYLIDEWKKRYHDFGTSPDAPASSALSEATA